MNQHHIGHEPIISDYIQKNKRLIELAKNNCTAREQVTMKDYRKILKETSGNKADAVIDMLDEIDKLRQVVAFYGCEAEAIAKYFNTNNDAVLASVIVLKLDAGMKAKSLIATPGVKRKGAVTT